MVMFNIFFYVLPECIYGFYGQPCFISRFTHSSNNHYPIGLSVHDVCWQALKGVVNSAWTSTSGASVRRLRGCTKKYMGQSATGWWFGTFFIFPYIGNIHPNWLSYFSEGFRPPTSQESGFPDLAKDWIEKCVQKWERSWNGHFNWQNGCFRVVFVPRKLEEEEATWSLRRCCIASDS